VVFGGKTWTELPYLFEFKTFRDISVTYKKENMTKVNGHSLIFKRIAFQDPVLFPFSDKETPNMVNPFDFYSQSPGATETVTC
jgi:hypothetical protein